MLNEKKHQMESSPVQKSKDHPASDPISTAGLLERVGLLQKEKGEGGKGASQPPKQNPKLKFFSLIIPKIPKLKFSFINKKDQQPQISSVPQKASFLKEFPNQMKKIFQRTKTQPQNQPLTLRLDNQPQHNQTLNPHNAAEPMPQDNILASDAEFSLKFDDLQAQFTELQSKYHRLETLFQEKGDALAKSDVALQNELKNRKEFNKVKDILEKELKEAKDRCRNLQIEVTSGQTESQSYLKRVNQLEEKIKKLEKEIINKEDELKEVQTTLSNVKNHISEVEEKNKVLETSLHEKNKRLLELAQEAQQDKKEGGPTEDTSPHRGIQDAPSVPPSELEQLPPSKQESPQNELSPIINPPEETTLKIDTPEMEMISSKPDDETSSHTHLESSPKLDSEKLNSDKKEEASTNFPNGKEPNFENQEDNSTKEQQNLPDHPEEDPSTKTENDQTSQ